MPRIRITQFRSVIGCPDGQRRTVRSLGLRKIGQSVVHEDTPSLRGMAFKVRHLVKVEPENGESGGSS
ncbi:MAG TPA: 50S ribosomal protein L30 [Actinomycetota bacterium]|nr:50S ribosomal protein L30 [Actinomycetota bacterium]